MKDNILDLKAFLSEMNNKQNGPIRSDVTTIGYLKILQYQRTPHHKGRYIENTKIKQKSNNMISEENGKWNGKMHTIAIIVYCRHISSLARSTTRYTGRYEESARRNVSS